MKKNVVPAVLVVGLLATLVAQAKLAGSGGEVRFSASGPGGLKIVGTTGDISVKDDGATVTVVVPLANLDTGIGLRNKHMREKYLEVAKYPNAELTVSRAALKLAEGSGTAAGTMKIHGQSHAVDFAYSAKRSGSGYAVDGTVHLDIHDYGIEVPSYLGVTVKPEIDVVARFVAVDN